MPADPTLADAEWLRQRYEGGTTVEAIASEIGVSPVNVWRALRRHEIPLRGKIGVRSWAETYTADYLGGLLAAGWSRSDIAREHECSISVVSEWIATHQLDDLDRAEARQLRRWYDRDGLSIGQVAAKLGVHPRTARRRLLSAGIELRPPGRRPVTRHR